MNVNRRTLPAFLHDIITSLRNLDARRVPVAGKAIRGASI
jgi:hypothetical protein